MRIYKTSTQPTSTSDDLQVGDLWVDTTSDAVLKVCTAVDADTFDTFQVVGDIDADVLTFLGTPSSSNLAAAIDDETGSGALVFATSPTLVTPNLGSQVNYTNTQVFSGTLPATGITTGNDTFNFSFTFSGAYGVTMLDIFLSAGLASTAVAKYTIGVNCAANSGTTTAQLGATVTELQTNFTGFTFADSGSQNRTFTISITRSNTAEDWASYGGYTVVATNNARTLTLNSVTASDEV